MLGHAGVAHVFGTALRLAGITMIGIGLFVFGSACRVPAQTPAAPGRWELKSPSGTIGGPFTGIAEGLPYGARQLTLNGRLTIWYSSGQAALAVDVKNGAPAGRFTIWHENGAKLAEGEFRDAIPQGVFTFWDSQGRRRMVYEFLDVSSLGPEDVNVKSMTMWDEQGRVIEATADDVFRLEHIEYFMWLGNFAHGAFVERSHGAQ